MNPINSHIYEYLEKYVNAKVAPHFAVLLKGDWGVGKSFFINDFISKHNSLKQDSICISLYGVSRVGDIDDKIFQAVHPLLASKASNVMSSLFKVASSVGIPIGDPANASKEAIKATNEFQKSKKVIVVEDIERSDLDVSIVFGFFYEMINSFDTRVVFVCNEKEIKCKNDYYIREKEKVVGQEFELQPVYEDAIESFLKECFTRKSKTKDILEKKTKEVLDNLCCNNLRIVRQAFLILKDIESFLEKDVDDADRENIIVIFLVLFIQKALAKIDAETPLADVINKYLKHKKAYDVPCGSEEDDLLQTNYIPLLDYWNDLIFKGNQNVMSIFAVYDKEYKDRLNRRGKKPANLFILMNEWRTCKPLFFENQVKKVSDEIDKGIYLHPSLLLHYANIMLCFSQWGLIPTSQKKIKDQIKKVYQAYPVLSVKDWSGVGYYGGWSLPSDISHMKDLFDWMKKRNLKRRNEDTKKSLNDTIIKLNDATIFGFCNDLTFANGTNKYLWDPVFKLMDVNLLYSSLEKLSLINQSAFISSLKNRYGLNTSQYSMPQYDEDLPNLKKLYQKFKKGNEKIKYNPVNFQRKFFSQDLDRIVKHIEMSINERR